MDMQMPVMDGIEATKQIRLKEKKIPIISLTANAMKSDYDKCIKAGADEFLTKPIDSARFTKTLYKYLNTREKSNFNKNMPNKLKKLTENFLLDLPNRLKYINSCYDNKAWQDLGNETHKLKAIGTPFGFPEITDFSDKISLACKNEEYQIITGYMDNLNSFCNKILTSN